MDEGATSGRDLHTLPRSEEGRARRDRAFETGLCLLVAALGATAVTDAVAMPTLVSNVALTLAVFGWSRAASRERRLADDLVRNRAELAECEARYAREVVWRLAGAGDPGPEAKSRSRPGDCQNPTGRR